MQRDLIGLLRLQLPPTVGTVRIPAMISSVIKETIMHVCSWDAHGKIEMLYMKLLACSSVHQPLTFEALKIFRPDSIS
jgi:hypothetical protein